MAGATWLPVRCTRCGWRGQKPTAGIKRTLTVTCPTCHHTGQVITPPPTVRTWPPAGVRKITGLWADGKTPPADWRSPWATS